MLSYALTESINYQFTAAVSSPDGGIAVMVQDTTDNTPYIIDIAISSGVPSIPW